MAVMKQGAVNGVKPPPSWEKRFKELETFRKKHGHCNVPKSFPLNRQLAYWVDSLRRRMKLGTLDRKTVRRLNGLGFTWTVLHRRFHRRDLDELVEFLKAFKKRHGHCDIQAAHEGVGGDIMDWLKDVRKAKKQGRLDSRRVRQFDRLGFVWHPQAQFPQEMCAALAAYRKQYGDCLVPTEWPENRRLGSWVSRMRAARRRNLLTKTQINQLDRIRFAWNSRFEHVWDLRLQQLEKFKRRHGHCNVPWDHAPNPALSRWVATARRQKRLGKLAKERIARLNALGFAWSSTPGKKLRRTTVALPPHTKPSKTKPRTRPSSRPAGSGRRQERRSAAKRGPHRRTSPSS